MAEEILISNDLTREAKYHSLILQIRSVIGEERNLIANLANIASGLKYGMEFFWVGFYIVDK